LDVNGDRIPLYWQGFVVEYEQEDVLDANGVVTVDGNGDPITKDKLEDGKRIPV
jgi:hypothetical protein